MGLEVLQSLRNSVNLRPVMSSASELLPIDTLGRRRLKIAFGWIALVMDTLGIPKHPPQIDLFGAGATGSQGLNVLPPHE